MRQVLASLQIIPVLTIDTVAAAVATCDALRTGGIYQVEITLRSPVALDAIAAVQAQFSDVTVAAGTIKSTRDIEALKQLDIAFGVSPGLTTNLLACARANDFCLLPGVASPSELMQGLEAGFTEFKLFPAAAVGGVALLKALADPFPEAGFCPTGGVTAENMGDYLALPNVLCVGGSWMVAPRLIVEQRWSTITELTRAALDC